MAFILFQSATKFFHEYGHPTKIYVVTIVDTTRRIRSRCTWLHISNGLLSSGALQGCLVRPDISKTLADRFECAFARPAAARVHPAGALAVTLLAVVSPASN